MGIGLTSDSAVLTAARHTYLSGRPRLEVLAFQAAHQVATLVKRRSWKAIMDAGGDPRVGNSLSLELIVGWLFVVGSLKTTFVCILHSQWGVCGHKGLHCYV